MNRQELERTVSLFYRSIRVADLERAVTLFAKDAVMHDPVGAPAHVGHDGIRKFLTGVLALCRRFDIAERATISHESSAAVTWAAYALGNNGAQVKFGGIDVFRFNDGAEIVSLHAFWDAGAILPVLES
jgi:ketosteroid isomerase-like protein